VLENREDRTGCRASLRIPLHAVAQVRPAADEMRDAKKDVEVLR